MTRRSGCGSGWRRTRRQCATGCWAVEADDWMLCLGDVAYSFALAGPKLTARLRAGPGRLLLVPETTMSTGGGCWARPVSSECVRRRCARACRRWCSHPPLTPPPAGAGKVHGHLHRRDPPSPVHWNVSVEWIGFRPVRLARLIAHNRHPTRAVDAAAEVSSKPPRVLDGERLIRGRIAGALP